MLIEKTFQGAIRITDIIDGYYITRQYFDYSKREAIQEFKAEVKRQKKERIANET